MINKVIHPDSFAFGDMPLVALLDCGTKGFEKVAFEKRAALFDDRLAEILNEEGIHIARRTVAKYREQLKIPVARLRKEL